MHIERLGFDQNTGYDGLEAAIHIARYSFVKRWCAGKRVLDIACGEGYGSQLMATWGATEVQGVDISAEAITHAKRTFSAPGVAFHEHAAETVDALFEPASFDLIVSFETIEHVGNPEAFLQAIRRLLKPGGAIVVSCPNDWWYFPDPQQRNPFHRRKFHFAEFQATSEAVLGSAARWFVGGPVVGFGNVPKAGYVQAQADSSQVLMQDTREADALVVPAEVAAGPTETNASYFIGVWGREAEIGDFYSGAILPLSMDAFKDGIFQGHLRDFEQVNAEVQQLTAKVQQLNADLQHKAEQIEKMQGQSQMLNVAEFRKAQLRNQALLAENELMREGAANLTQERLSLLHDLAQLREENARLSVAAARYVRLRNLVPAVLRRPALRMARLLRKSAHD